MKLHHNTLSGIIRRVFVITLASLYFIGSGLAQNIKPSLLGGQAPEVRLINKLQPFNHDDYKGKILVMDFWATWCAPCIAGFPHMNQLVQHFKNENVVFAAINEEPVKTVETFFYRTKKKLDLLHLADDGATFDNYHITAIPTCVVIDKNNIVRWVGIGSQLTEQIIRNIINEDYKANSIQKQDDHIAVINVPGIPVEKPVFSFKITKADPLSAEGGPVRTSPHMGLVNFTRTNIMLKDLLPEITGLGSSQRIISKDSSKLNEKFSISFNTSSSIRDTAMYSNYKNTYVPDEPRTNYLLNLLQENLHFKLEIIEQDQEVYTLVVRDKEKINAFKSLQETHSSNTGADNFPDFEIVGYSLKDLTIELEKETQKIITCNIQDTTRYDLSLDISSISKLNRRLNFYGLQLNKTNEPVKLLKIQFL